MSDVFWKLVLFLVMMPHVYQSILIHIILLCIDILRIAIDVSKYALCFQT